MQGQDKIEAAHESLQETAACTLGKKIVEFIICPIYANLPCPEITGDQQLYGV